MSDESCRKCVCVSGGQVLRNYVATKEVGMSQGAPESIRVVFCTTHIPTTWSAIGMSQGAPECIRVVFCTTHIPTTWPAIIPYYEVDFILHVSVIFSCVI
ncbi:unnamed protein product [Leptidea sinapis]|uniref:Uncharacterized protein n=1 Tax=Leptidea sinapis TaxID=189913 RepID=A0A5E4PTG8_9NEOP|nr:unnamed protein product [Leptidea sinapis]